MSGSRHRTVFRSRSRLGTAAAFADTDFGAASRSMIPTRGVAHLVAEMCLLSVDGEQRSKTCVSVTGVLGWKRDRRHPQ
jgi:hypothetical protein